MTAWNATRYLSLGEPVYEISRHLAPVLVLQPGETVTVETEDAHTHQISKPGDRRDRTTVPFSNPLSGPIAVRGAEPGDALRITIREIAPLEGQCETYAPLQTLVSPHLGADVEDQTRICRVDAEGVHWDAALVIPYAPMVGCIATAPELGTPTTGPAGDYGGNLDLPEIAPGAMLWLPVFVPGAALFLGDCHAAQGAGELSGCALEMRGRVTFSVDLAKQVRLPGPRIEGPDSIFAVASGNSLEAAVALAYSRLALWLESDWGWNRWEAYSLLSQVGCLSIGFFAGGAVAAGIAREYAGAKKGVSR